MSTAYMRRWTMASKWDVIVVGGGAAGMFSAGVAAERRLRVLLLERNRDMGKKLRITGKGRCNVLNDCGPEDVLKNVPTGSRFLYSSVYGFPPEETKKFFENIGVPLKRERGDRVFPQSDRAADVVAALEQWMRNQGVEIRRGRVRRLLVENGTLMGVRTESETFYAPQVILATGGMSYPATGSTGDGYALAAQAGHTVVAPSGSLVPLEVEGGCRELAGLSLRNTGLTLWGSRKKPVYQDFGELLFMNYGMSGPTVLSASAHMQEKDGPYRVELDLKPALDEAKLDARLLRDFGERKNDKIMQGLRGLLPAQLVPVILDRCAISVDQPVHDVTKQQRREILHQLKHLTFAITGKRPVEEAIVTHGGVKVSEVNPRTMESKKLSGLHFAGEILDCDAYTGGFNLQIAWSTGYAAGTSCGNRGESVV